MNIYLNFGRRCEKNLANHQLYCNKVMGYEGKDFWYGRKYQGITGNLIPDIITRKLAGEGKIKFKKIRQQ